MITQETKSHRQEKGWFAFAAPLAGEDRARLAEAAGLPAGGLRISTNGRVQGRPSSGTEP